MEFFTELEKLLLIPRPRDKCDAFKDFYKDYKGLKKDHTHKALQFSHPSYRDFCQEVSPDVVMKRKKLSTDKGKAIFLHAIAHIEYSAIDLAMDAAYRFKEMPESFYDDWLSVANDEVKHFLLLEELLADVDASYGKFPVHNLLFDASVNTQNIHERMAVVPRYLEANGLDATPTMIEKLRQIKDEKSDKIIEVLEIILEEEVDHVKKGDIWFKYVCDKEELPYSSYFEVIEKYYPDSFPRKKEINIEARKEVGFSCEELKIMNTGIEC